MDDDGTSVVMTIIGGGAVPPASPRSGGSVASWESGMPRGVRDEGKVVRARLIVERVLARSNRKGWDAPMTATVIVRSLRPARVAAGVVGPCFYCGDELADTVDHMVPVAGGGTDDRSNLVSACWPCNELKGTIDLDHFRYQYPYGSHAARNRAFRLDRDESPVYRRHMDWLYERALKLDRSVSIPFGDPVITPGMELARLMQEAVGPIDLSNPKRRRKEAA